jgi:hypothetical protein
MEIFDSFLAQNGSIGFESFVPKARRILKLPSEPFGKSYAIALPFARRDRSPRFRTTTRHARL